MKTIILHIGHAKTGSSVIQSHLALNRASLATAGIDYPLAPGVEKAAQGKVTNGNVPVVADWLDRVTATARASDCPTVLFSSEALQTRIADEAARMATTEGIRFRVIVYVRDPLSLLFSSYSQAVRRGGATETLDAFAAIDRITLNVAASIRALDAAGIEVTVINYSRQRARVMDTFAAALGLDLSVFGQLPASETINRSLTLGEMRLLRLFNETLGKTVSAEVSDALVNELTGLKGEREALGQPAYEGFVAATRPGVEAINRHLPEAEALVIEPYDPRWAEVAAGVRFDEAQLRLIGATLAGILRRAEGQRESAVRARDAARLRAEEEAEAETRRLRQQLEAARAELARPLRTALLRAHARLRGRRYNPATGRMER